jgi:hypothetical protein
MGIGSGPAYRLLGGDRCELLQRVRRGKSSRSGPGRGLLNEGRSAVARPDRRGALPFRAAIQASHAASDGTEQASQDFTDVQHVAFPSDHGPPCASTPKFPQRMDRQIPAGFVG